VEAMTPEQINREFAEKVMGWKLETRQIWSNDVKHYVPTEVYVKDSDKRRFIQVSNWNPYHRWAHAAMGLEKFLSWEIRRYSRKDYRCRINDDELIEGPMADTAPAAICLACLEAKKEKK
jgi:hypothetical protein